MRFFRKSKDQDSRVEPVMRDDGAPEYPNRYDVPALKERRYLWTARILAFVAALSILLNVTLGWAIVAMLPLKQIQPFLVQMVEDKNVLVTIKPLPDSINALDGLTEKLVAEYVKMRHEIVRSEKIMSDRWLGTGYVGLMTDRKEYERFLAQIKPVFEELRKQDVTQEVTILSVTTLRKNSVYQVEFETVGRGPQNNIVLQKRWMASLEVTYRKLTNVPMSARTINPTGFTVLNYSIAEKVVR